MMNFIINKTTKNGFPYTGTEMPEYLHGDVNHVMISIPEEHVELVSKIQPFKASTFIKQDENDTFYIDVDANLFKRYNIQDILTERNQKLSQSDWTRMDDNGLSEEQREAWRIYRQQLRDLPQNIVYSDDLHPVSIQWPTPPL